MSDQDRTESPTPRRREQSRRRGQVLRSREVTSAAVLVGALVMLAWWGPSMRETLLHQLQQGLVGLGTRQLSQGEVLRLAWASGVSVALAAGPILLMVLAMGVLAGLGQVGVLLTTEPVMPRLDRLDPMQGARRLFSLRSLAESARTFLKLGVIGWTAYAAYRDDLPHLLALIRATPEEAMRVVAAMALHLAMKVALLCAGIAALDYLYQRWEHERGMRMTRQEIRDEHRQNEGDPRLRSRRRELMRRMSRGRSVAQVPQATAVLTNPTHYAVAFRWEEGSMDAPRVIAKGAGAAAARIRDEALRHRVPVLQRPALARTLFRQVRIGQEIPASLYDAMAEVVVYLHDLKGE